MEIQKELYRWLNEKGVYINAPDWYFLDGTHKIAIGYREVNFSLSREQQRVLNRQNIHDGTLEKMGSMSWGFVPLTKYQGGGPEAILEPLSEHLKDYENLEKILFSIFSQDNKTGLYIKLNLETSLLYLFAINNNEGN